MGTSDAAPLILETGAALVRELGVPVRLALAARYRSSEGALEAWSNLARETGLRLGVRLVKGSFIEADQPDAINTRGPLLAHYKRLITLALLERRYLDVAVATQNAEIWNYAQAEARRLGADYSVNTIRGVNPALQAEMRASGRLKREFISYGVDAPLMGLSELWFNWKQRRTLKNRRVRGIDYPPLLPHRHHLRPQSVLIKEYSHRLAVGQVLPKSPVISGSDVAGRLAPKAHVKLKQTEHTVVTLWN